MAGALALFACAPAFSQSLSKEMTWTAYDSGSAGFNIALAIGDHFKGIYRSDVRILAQGNDTGRLAPVRANRAVISQMGIGTYFAQEGVFEFGAKSWGPQPVRLLMSATSCNGLGLAVAGDSGVQEIKDLKGKRVAVVVGSPSLSQGALALIAFGGLTEHDVTLVRFTSNNAMWKGLIDNQADALLSSTLSSQSKEAASAPRGLRWPAMPAEDKAGWGRVHKKAPYFVPQKVTCGWGGMSEQTPVVMASYAYPLFMTYAERSTETIAAITNVMVNGFEAYKDAAPGADGMALSRQNFEWVVPYHDGAIKTFKERGVWTQAAQKHNDGLVKRQQVMMDAWKIYGVTAPADEKAFADGWLKARAAALSRAGMEVIFE